MLEHVITHVLNSFVRRPAKKETPGIVLGRSVGESPDSVVWPDAQRREHAVIIGKTGTGKTHLLELLALQLAARSEGFCVFDFHGDASLSLLERLGGTKWAGRLIVLDPSHPTLSPGINVL